MGPGSTSQVGNAKIYSDGPSLYWPPLAQVLKDVGLHEFDAELPIGWAEYLVACGALIETTGDPFVGLEVGHRMSLGTHGLLGHASLSCTTLGESLDLIVRFPPFHEQGGRASLSVVDGMAVLEYAPPAVLPGAPRFFTDMFFAAIAQATRELAEGPNDQIRFELDRNVVGKIDDRFSSWVAPAVLSATGSDRLCAPVEIMANAIVSGTAPGALLHKRLCERLLQQSQAGEGLAGVVRRHLVAGGAPYATVAEVASAAGLHERTLRRRLKDEGTSFQGLLDEVRCHMASEYLSGSSLPTTTIAKALGFSDHANFNRAFKRWTGQTPSTFRASTRPRPSAASVAKHHISLLSSHA